MIKLSLFKLIAAKVGVSAQLLISVCSVETGLVNKNNFEDRVEASLGVCQVQLTTARRFGKHYDMLALQQVDFNILIAAKYLKYQLNRYKNTYKAVGAYNAGSYIEKSGRAINEKYINRVLY